MELKDYIEKHMTGEPEVLYELWRETNARIYNPRMCSGHYQGMALRMVSLMLQPQLVLEIGTYTGYSAICLTEGLPPGGKVYTIEENQEFEEIMSRYFQKAGVENKINTYFGNAIDIIPRFAEMFDLVFIDGDKKQYLEYFNLVIEKVRPGGFIIADNVLWDGKVTDTATRDPQTRGLQEFNDFVRYDNRVECMIWTLRDGWMVMRKK
jgi:predicted O-methyltransferase YrrM